MADNKPMTKALQRIQPDPAPPAAGNRATVAIAALSDAAVEDLRFLQDLALEIPYADFAHRGVKVQVFLRIRQLAFHDAFEELEEDAKLAALGLPEEGLEALRANPIYDEIKERFVELAGQLAKPESDRAFLARIGARNRKNLERFARTSNPNHLPDAARASAELLERTLPKASRATVQLGPTIQITEQGAALLAKAFAEAKLPPPEIPVDAEVVDEEPEK